MKKKYGIWVGVVFIILAFFICFQTLKQDGAKIKGSESVITVTPQELETHQKVMKYFQASLRAARDPSVPKPVFPKDIQHISRDFFITEAVRAYQNEPFYREGKKTIEMAEKRIVELAPEYEKVQQYLANLPQMKIERAEQREKWRKSAEENKSLDARLNKLHEDVLELLEQSEGLNTNNSIDKGPPETLPEARLTSSARDASSTLADEQEKTYSELDVFIPDAFRSSFQSQLSEWNADIDGDYLDVVLVPYLSEEEFEEFYPNDAARQILNERQQQMQADIATRVQSFLSDDTPGSRDEKISIIRETLSENWSPDIADNVIERLQ